MLINNCFSLNHIIMIIMNEYEMNYIHKIASLHIIIIHTLLLAIDSSSRIMSMQVCLCGISQGVAISVIDLFFLLLILTDFSLSSRLPSWQRFIFLKYFNRGWLCLVLMAFKNIINRDQIATPFLSI